MEHARGRKAAVGQLHLQGVQRDSLELQRRDGKGYSDGINQVIKRVRDGRGESVVRVGLALFSSGHDHPQLMIYI
jgi:hypothetical protein